MTDKPETMTLNLPKLPIILGKKVREGLNVARHERDWNRAILIDVEVLHYLAEDEAGNRHLQAVKGPVYIGQLCAAHCIDASLSKRPLLHIELDPPLPANNPGAKYLTGPRRDGLWRSQNAALGGLQQFARFMAMLGVWR